MNASAGQFGCGAGGSVLYELIRSGQLRTVKQGRRRLVPVSALAEYVASLESGIA
jgi:excisionase family DNA binding protein